VVRDALELHDGGALTFTAYEQQPAVMDDVDEVLFRCESAAADVVGLAVGRPREVVPEAGDFESAFAGLAPDVEWHFGDWIFDVQVIHGRQEVIDFYRRLGEAGRWEVEAHEVEEMGPGMLLVRQTGRATGRATGIVTERESFFVYELGPSGVKRLREFATREDALGAARGG